MVRPYDIMIAGHLCLDIIPRFPQTGSKNIADILRPGKLVNVESAKISTGGPVSNTGINMKTLGSKVCFCACVGDDVLGQLTVDILKASGNADGIHPVKGAASSYTVVVAPPGIDRIFLHNPGTNNYFGAENLDPDLIRQCRHFHFGYPPLMSRMFADEGRELEKIFRIAKEAGATTSCDMTLPDPSSPSGKRRGERYCKGFCHISTYICHLLKRLFICSGRTSFLPERQSITMPSLSITSRRRNIQRRPMKFLQWVRKWYR